MATPSPSPPPAVTLLREHVHAERATLAAFLEAVAEFDRRALWRELGHPSLLAWLTRGLGLSATAAYQRRVAVELLQRFPELGDAFRDGRICLATVVDLARAMSGGGPGRIPARLLQGPGAAYPSANSSSAGVK